MMNVADVTIWVAFGAGMLSFLNPCTLPIFPAYLSYITGVSIKELEDSKEHHIRGKLLLHAIFFLIGVSLVFISLGVSVSFLSQWISSLFTGQTGIFLQRIAGIFIIVMGLFVAGWLTIPSLMREKRFQFAKKPVGYLGTVFVGIGFAAGWTPCIGPIFTSILLLAASNPTQATLYTFVYVIGFAVPFLLLTFFIGSTRWIVRYSEKIMKVGGTVMIAMGLVLFSGQLSRISSFIFRLVDDSWFSILG